MTSTMQYTPSNIYTRSFPNLAEQIARAVDNGCRKVKATQPIELFFRADDIGVPSRQFRELITLFDRHQLPLCLAVVPSWLSRKRYVELRAITGDDDNLWCWHQHGRLHKNFEPAGKKQEFGPARDYDTVLRHIKLGKKRLETYFGDAFEPFFTPPWNRCSLDTIKALHATGFKAVSRDLGAQPDSAEILPDLQVNVDLHTRKDPNPETGLQTLLHQLENALASGRCGIMIHHQRMNKHAILFMDIVMEQLSKKEEIIPRSFRNLA